MSGNTWLFYDLSHGVFVFRKVSFYEQKVHSLQGSNQWLLRSGNLFVVQWDNVHLKDREDEGSFTFQAALHRNGTIVFSYKDVSKKLQFHHSDRGLQGENHSHQTDYFSGSSATGENQFHRTSSQSGDVRCIHGSPFSTRLRSVLQNDFYINYPHKMSEFIVFKWHQ